MQQLRDNAVALMRAVAEEVAERTIAFPRYPLRVQTVALAIAVTQGLQAVEFAIFGPGEMIFGALSMVVLAIALSLVERHAEWFGERYVAWVHGLLFVQLCVYLPLHYIMHGSVLDGMFVVAGAVIYLTVSGNPSLALRDWIVGSAMVVTVVLFVPLTHGMPWGDIAKVELMAVGACVLYTVNEVYIRRSRLAMATSLMAVLAHELRTPLATIALEADYLSAKAKSDADAEMQQVVSKIQRTTRHLNNVIDTQIANARSAAIIGSTQRIDVGELIVNLVEDFPFGGDDADAAIQVEIDGDMWIRASRVVLTQVMTNLLRNAITAVQRTKRQLTAGDVLIRGYTDERGRLVIEVIDKGIGIPASDVHRIFDPFFSTSPSANHGLGLAFVQQAVRTMGGSIRVESVAGAGTTFTLSLPGKEAQA